MDLTTNPVENICYLQVISYHPNILIHMSEDQSSPLTQLPELIETAVTGLPVPVRKNFFKAIAQLSTAVVDIPVAGLEGKAAETRASTGARLNIIRKEGEAIAGSLKVPAAYVERASEKYASKIIREQLNLDRIVKVAVDEIAGTEPTERVSKDEISDEWLSEFEAYACLKSSEEMSFIFGKILAGEIKRPGAFSVRTVRVISQLDSDVAKDFQLFCSMAVSARSNDEVLSSMLPVFADEYVSTGLLADYGLTFFRLSRMQEYGLISTQLDSVLNFAFMQPEELPPLTAAFYAGKYYCVRIIDRKKSWKKAKIRGIRLTTAGNELAGITPVEENEAFSEDLFAYLKTRNLKLVKMEDCGTV